MLKTRDPQLSEAAVPGAKIEIARVVRSAARSADELQKLEKPYWIEPVVTKIEKPAE